VKNVALVVTKRDDTFALLWVLRCQLKRPISEALICNARYFEYIRHWAKLPAINQRPG
jgi:hypothetical protein